MKNNIFKKISLALVVMLALLQVFSLTAFAETEDFEWSMSFDGETLYYDQSYELYEAKFPLYPIASEIYIYSQDLFWSGTIETDLTNEGIVWVEDVGIDFYVTNSGKKKLDDFFGGEIGGFLLSESADYYYNAELEKGIVEALDKAYDEKNNMKTVDVKSLKSLESYHVLAVDKTYTAAYAYGAVYVLESGETCYLSYKDLGNQYFDADGNFSYRSGEVDVTIIESSLVLGIVKAKNNLVENYPNYTWEDDDLLDIDIMDMDEGMLIIVFWVCFIILGFILPVPFLVIGLLFPRSKKKGEPKYWYILAAIAGLWIVLSAILLLIILLV